MCAVQSKEQNKAHREAPDKYLEGSLENFPLFAFYILKLLLSGRMLLDNDVRPFLVIADAVFASIWLAAHLKLVYNINFLRPVKQNSTDSISIAVEEL